MCAACGVTSHVPEPDVAIAAAPRRFAALRNRDCRPYLFGAALAMMADNIEHVGSVLLLGLGPTAGIFANIAFYLPLTLFLFRTKFTGHTRDGVARLRVGILDSVRVLRKVGADHTLVSMIILGGLGSFFVGASIQASMPIFAQDLGAGSAGSAYGILLFANGAGGVIGGILLEATGRVRPSVAAAVISTGVYGMSANGLRFGSGITVGLLGAVVGIHWSLGLSAAALCVGTVLAAVSARANHTRHAALR
jgi:hypothetical protein